MDFDIDSLFRHKIKEEQDIIDESLIGDFIFDQDPKGHGRPKSKKGDTLFSRCRMFLDEAVKRLENYKSLKKDN